MFHFGIRQMLFLGILLAILLSPLGAENLGTTAPLHVLKEMEYQTDKYTRESALARELGIPDGKSFNSRDELDAYLADKAQDLINLRVFENVNYLVEEIESPEGARFYRGIIIVDGAWTLYPIPYPKYDSNTGLRAGLKIYYYNFFGTLTNFYLGTNVDVRSGDDGEWEIPQWTVNPVISNIALFGQRFALDFVQSYQESSKYDDEAKDYIEKYNYYSTSVALSTTLRFPWHLYYSFSPSLAFYYGYEDQLPNNGSNIVEEDVIFSYGHSIGRNNIDWKGNFRHGLAGSLSHSIGYVQEDTSSLGSFQTDLWATVTGFYPWKIFNPSFRMRGFYSFNNELTGLGSRMRGIRDDSIYGITGGFLNTSLNISVIRWKGVGEAQFQPFFDLGIVKREDADFSWDQDFKYSTGADFILYLDKLKSLVAVGSIGIDLTNPDWSDGRKYDISIESKLFY